MKCNESMPTGQLRASAERLLFWQLWAVAETFQPLTRKMGKELSWGSSPQLMLARTTEPQFFVGFSSCKGMWRQVLQASLLLTVVSGGNGTCRPEEASFLQASAPTRAALTQVADPCSRRMTFDSSVHPFPVNSLYWLHFPKAGTSFIATIWNYACGQGGDLLDLTVSDKYGPHCGHCYDFALMERYPKAEYCTEGVLHRSFTTTHRPVSEEQLLRDQIRAAALFRQPSQRIISAHNDGFHANGFSKNDTEALLTACRGNSSIASHECFARFPGIAGCMTRMLTGKTCAEGSVARGAAPFDGGKALVLDAKKTIAGLAFVGLTERWNETVCLFHRMFGGSINPAEFMNFHHNHKHGSQLLYQEDSLNGFRDDADEEIYAAAQQRFESLLKEHVPAGQSACHSLSQLSQEDCRCQTQGRQCGLMPGTGLDCGQCPRNRMAFLPGGDLITGGWQSVVVPCEDGRCKATSQQVPAALFDWTPGLQSDANVGRSNGRTDR